MDPIGDAVAHRHTQFLELLKRTASEISAQCLSHIHSLSDWQTQRAQTQRELRYMLGLDPLPKRTPLNARITGTLDRDSYRIQKVVFQSLPGLYVTANLYIPNALSEPAATILYVCGHSPHPCGTKVMYQDRAAAYVDQGYACLIVDTLEYGEVPGIHHGTHNLNLWNWLALGYTPLGVEVWNAIRALDYLESVPDVDATRVGMTGFSGGGAVTWFTAAVDERVAAAVPVCSTYTFGSQAANWLAFGQCDCIFMHNTFWQDLTTVAALIAPRPLLILSGMKDSIFPPDGYHEVYRQAKRVYDLYGESERIREVDEDVGHADTTLLRMEAMEWMNRWLGNPPTSLGVEPISDQYREPDEALSCLSRLPEDAVNYRIHESFIAPKEFDKPASLEAWKARRKVLLTELKDKIFRWFPQTSIPFETRVRSRDCDWVGRYADYRDVVFDSEAGSPIRVRLLLPKGDARQKPLLIYAKRARAAIFFPDLDELTPVLGRCPVVILNPRMTEPAVSAREYAEIERTSAWIGRTVAAMQVWDILRAVQWAHQEAGIEPTSITVYGKGEMGIIGLYAGLFDERIKQIVVRDPTTSHWQGPALLNILRITDIPEVAAAFAPRKLVFIKDIPSAFTDTKQIYELVGNGGYLEAAESLPEALQVWRY